MFGSKAILKRSVSLRADGDWAKSPSPRIFNTEPPVLVSAVGGILDPYGGLRVVATANGFEAHTKPYELCIVVPGLKVQTPVPWDRIPWLIRKVEKYVDWWISTRNDPDILNDECVVMRKLRMSRTYNRGSVNLYDIVET